MKASASIQGACVLITGAASGIGRALALRCAELGARELVLWDLCATALATVEVELEELRDAQRVQGEHSMQDHQPLSVRTSALDVSNAERVEAAAKTLAGQAPPDILINCAGITTGDYFHELTAEDIQRTIGVNVTGSMLVTRAFLSRMIKRGTGHVVNIGSASSYIGVPRLSVYAASKWAVLGWSESLRIEMNELGVPITVTAILPSFINTGMFDGVKAPRLVPLLSTKDITEKILWSIEKKKTIVRAPIMVRAVPLLKVLLPQGLFDRVAGQLLGVYRAMDQFRGRQSTH